MTSLATRATKKLQRKLRNLENKRVRAAQRQIELVELGKSLVKTEKDGVTTYDLPEVQEAPAFNNPPHLSFVGLKRYRHQFAQGKTRPGNKELHAEAIVEDASRTFTKECDKAMGVLAVNGEPIGEPQLDHGDGL